MGSAPTWKSYLDLKLLHRWRGQGEDRTAEDPTFCLKVISLVSDHYKLCTGESGSCVQQQICVYSCFMRIWYDQNLWTTLLKIKYVSDQSDQNVEVGANKWGGGSAPFRSFTLSTAPSRSAPGKCFHCLLKALCRHDQFQLCRILSAESPTFCHCWVGNWADLWWKGEEGGTRALPGARNGHGPRVTSWHRLHTLRSDTERHGERIHSLVDCNPL